MIPLMEAKKITHFLIFENAHIYNYNFQRADGKILYYSQINFGICECDGWFLEISFTETMRPEPGSEKWMEFYREWGRRRPIIEGGNDGQTTQEHARWLLYSWICQWEGKSSKIKSQQSKKCRLWLWSGAYVGHVRKISHSQFWF